MGEHAHTIDDEGAPERFDREFLGKDYAIPGAPAGNPRMVPRLLSGKAEARAPYLSATAVDAPGDDELSTTLQIAGGSMPDLFEAPGDFRSQ